MQEQKSRPEVVNALVANLAETMNDGNSTPAEMFSAAITLTMRLGHVILDLSKPDVREMNRGSIESAIGQLYEPFRASKDRLN